MADWWNPVSWDWGGAGHEFNNSMGRAGHTWNKGDYLGGTMEGLGSLFAPANHLIREADRGTGGVLGNALEFVTATSGGVGVNGTFGPGVAPGSSGVTGFSGTSASQSGGRSSSLLPSESGGVNASFGTAPVKASSNFWFNGPAPGGGGTAPQGGSNMEGLEGLLAQIARQQMGYMEADRATRGSLMSGLAGMTNPYSGSALEQALALQSGSIQRGFNTAQDQTMRSLAQRGALGTAQETSARRQIELDRARALSGAEASTRTDYASRAADFGQRQYGLQAGLLGMAGGGNPASIFQGLLGRQDDREARDSHSQSQFWGNIGALVPTAATIGYDVWKNSQKTPGGQ